MRLGWSLAVQPNCLKGRVVCGTVYGEMHLKDLLGSFVRVGYRIPVPEFCLVLHGLRCGKKHYNGLNQAKPNHESLDGNRGGGWWFYQLVVLVVVPLHTHHMSCVADIPQIRSGSHQDESEISLWFGLLMQSELNEDSTRQLRHIKL